MSLPGVPVTLESNNNSLQWRNYSGELDVFEATKYFCSADDNNAHIGQNPIKNVRRMSLDMPKRRTISLPKKLQSLDQKQVKEKKKHKQPSSPGARIASFLSSLFNQKSVKKKNPNIDDQDGEIHGDQRRRSRRSSISHFPVSNSALDSKSIYSTSSSGFTTPRVYANTPTKLHKEFRSYSDPLREHVVSVGKSREDLKPGLLKLYEVKRGVDYAWLDEKLGLRNESSEFSDNYSSKGRGFRKFSNGGDSDSSSDLFDLPNHDLELPVYETTQMDRINKSVII